MTLKAGTPPERGPLAWMIGGPLAIIMGLLIASMFGWVMLGLPVTAYDPSKMPQFIWYYRGDPRVVRRWRAVWWAASRWL